MHLTNCLQDSIKLVDLIPLTKHEFLQVRSELLLVNPVHPLELCLGVLPVTLKVTLFFILMIILKFRFYLDQTYLNMIGASTTDGIDEEP